MCINYEAGFIKSASNGVIPIKGSAKVASFDTQQSPRAQALLAKIA